MTTPPDEAPEARQPPPETLQSPPQPIVYWEAPKEEAGPAPGVKFAGHGPRLVAYIIDTLIVGVAYVIFFFVAAAVLVAVSGPGDFNNGIPRGRAAGAIALFGLLFLVTFLIALAYFPFFWARSGQTPGMRPFGLYVVRDSDGGKISSGQAILRMIGLWVAALPLYLGFIWVFIDVRRRGWHDLIAGTVVIERTRP